jgi:hypothetical protein
MPDQVTHCASCRIIALENIVSKSLEGNTAVYFIEMLTKALVLPFLIYCNI